MWYLVNGITLSRILLALVLIVLPPFSAGFVLTYLFCGLSDMLDGALARKTHTQSRLGGFLDSITDCVFLAVCAVRLGPVLSVPRWGWLWAGGVLAVKAVNILSGIVLHRCFFLHTAANKLTGLLLFVLPLLQGTAAMPYWTGAVCLCASFAAVQEGHFIRTGRGYPRESDIGAPSAQGKCADEPCNPGHIIV